jgi:hypothetical protein
LRPNIHQNGPEILGVNLPDNPRCNFIMAFLFYFILSKKQFGIGELVAVHSILVEQEGSHANASQGCLESQLTSKPKVVKKYGSKLPFLRLDRPWLVTRKLIYLQPTFFLCSKTCTQTLALTFNIRYGFWKCGLFKCSHFKLRVNNLPCMDAMLKHTIEER